MPVKNHVVDVQLRVLVVKEVPAVYGRPTLLSALYCVLPAV